MAKSKQYIPFTFEQIEQIKQWMLEENSLIVNKKIWSKIQSQFGVSTKQAFTRRTNLSGSSFKLGFEWKEFIPGKDSTKSPLQIRCVYCTAIYVSTASSLHLRKEWVEACVRCYVKHHIRNAAWKENQGIKQRIAQNRPETLEKHKRNSAALWQGEHRKVMVEAQLRTVSTPKYKENMAKAISKLWESNPEYRDRVSGKGVYKHVGVYDTKIVYHSKLELAFLLWCRDNNKQVKRCDFYIRYVDTTDNVEHKYYPDFVVDDTIIVEVKGQRWIDLRPEMFSSKISALKNFCVERDFTYRIFLDRDLKSYWKEARDYHEAQKQKTL